MRKTLVPFIIIVLINISCVNDSIPTGDSEMSATINGKSVEFTDIKCSEYMAFGLTAKSSEYNVTMEFNSVYPDTYKWENTYSNRGSALVPYLTFGNSDKMIDSLGEFIVGSSNTTTRNFKATFNCTVYNEALKETTKVLDGAMNVFYTRSK